MSLPDEKRFLTRVSGMQSSWDDTEKMPIHPDDFEAHLAWVTAKRYHEMAVKKDFRKNLINSGLPEHEFMFPTAALLTGIINPGYEDTVGVPRWGRHHTVPSRNLTDFR
jgi:hypothetical protein